LPVIQDGLRQASGGNEASTKVRDALKQLLLDAPMGKHELVEAGNISVGKAVEKESLEEANLKKSKVLKAWIRRAKSIPINAWLKFQKEDQEPQFMRLVWVADGYTKFVFVNHQGMKVIELGLFKLAQYLKTGDVMPDPDYDLPIVNQGLDNMVKDVYEKLAFESSHDKETGLVNSHEFVRAIKKEMQQGARTNPCCILYVRLFMNGLSEEQEASARAPIEQVLTTLDKEGNLAARLNRYDFAAFVSGNESELSVGLWAEQVRLAYSEMKSLSGADQPLQFKMSESWGYLGFNNPNTLLSGAVDALEKVEFCASSNSKVELELPEQATDTGDTNAACRVNAQSLGMFKVYKQYTRKINDQALLSEQLKLICTLADEDLPFVPEDKAEATAMGQWWINYFVKQQVALVDVETERALRIPISAHTLLDEDFKAELIQALKDGKIDAQKVWFDVSEGYLIQNEHEAADIIRELQFLGFHVALDKFGTSECPFRLLQVLPVDMIIIDEAYAQESALEDEEKEGAVQSVVEVAHHFEKAVLADGVDSAICLQRMQRQHVDFVQGETVSHYELLVEA
jgi:EAL domain-containing protein (putative c-di-GMP-specific phosphodiesterase class I)